MLRHLRHSILEFLDFGLVDGVDKVSDFGDNAVMGLGYLRLKELELATILVLAISLILVVLGEEQVLLVHLGCLLAAKEPIQASQPLLMDQHLLSLESAVLGLDPLHDQVVVVGHHRNQDVEADDVDDECAQNVKQHDYGFLFVKVCDVFAKNLLVLFAEDSAEAVVDWEGLVVVDESADREVYHEQERNDHELEGFDEAVFDDQPGCAQLSGQPRELDDEITNDQEGTYAQNLAVVNLVPLILWIEGPIYVHDDYRQRVNVVVYLGHVLASKYVNLRTLDQQLQSIEDNNGYFVFFLWVSIGCVKNKANVHSEQTESKDSIVLLPPLVINEVSDVSSVENIRNVIINLVQELDALIG